MLLNKTKPRDIAIGGMLAGVTLLLLFISSVIPTAKLSVAFVASFIPCITNIECKSKLIAFASEIATAILAFFLIPKSGLSGLIIVFFSLCFSYYPSLKLLIEKKNNIVYEWILKEIYFVLISTAVTFIAKKLAVMDFNILIFIASLTAYDILLSLGIAYYIKKIRTKIK